MCGSCWVYLRPACLLLLLCDFDQGRCCSGAMCAMCLAASNRWPPAALLQRLAEAAAEAEPLLQRLLAQHVASGSGSVPAGTCAAGSAEERAAVDGAGSSSATNSGGESSGGDAAPVLVSGAGHDAMVFADVTRMGMLFVRCRWAGSGAMT